MQRILAASLVPSHDFNFRVTSGATVTAERDIMIVGDDPIVGEIRVTSGATVHAGRDIMVVGDDPIGEIIELKVRVQHSYYVDAFDRTVHHLFPRVPLVGTHCRLARLEHFGSDSYVYFECPESNGTTFMFVARIERWWAE